MLELLVAQYKGLAEPDYIAVSQCLLWLDDAKALADILVKLAAGDEVQCAVMFVQSSCLSTLWCPLTKDHVLMSYQIAFDCYANAKQEFMQKLIVNFPANATKNAMETDEVRRTRVGVIGWSVTNVTFAVRPL